MEKWLMILFAILGIVSLTAVLIPAQSADLFLNIPPTPALYRINSTGEDVTSDNYKQSIKFLAGSGMTIVGNNSTKTITFSSTGGAPSCLPPVDCQTFDTLENIGSGEAFIYAGNTTDTNFTIKTLKEGQNVFLINGTSEITISSAGWQNNTDSNVGIGVGIFQTQVGDGSRFHSLLAGSGISISDIGDEIQIDSTSLSNLLTSGHIFVGNSTDFPKDVAMSGDVTIDNTGATTIGASKVTSSMLAGSIDATKIADGSVTSSEFQYINTLSSNAQDQINSKQATLSDAANIAYTDVSNVFTANQFISKSSPSFSFLDTNEVGNEIGYIMQSTAGILRFGTATDVGTFSAEFFRISRNGLTPVDIQVSTSLAMKATQKIFLDGIIRSDGVASGGDTYLYESSANVLDTYVGGVNLVKLSTTTMTVTGNAQFTGNSLQHFTDGASSGLTSRSYGGQGVLNLQAAVGSQATPTKILSGQAVSQITTWGYQEDTPAFSAVGRIQLNAAENYTGTGRGSWYSFIYPAIGTTSIVEKVRFRDTGDIGILAGSKLILNGVSATATEYITRSGTGVLDVYSGSTLNTSFKTASLTLSQKIINTAISDPAAAAGQFWLSSTNADVMKYSSSSTIYNILSTKGVVVTSTPSDPTGTTSATAVMMGMAGSITPATTTRAYISICGQMANSVINDGATVQLKYGTGTAPTNGAATTGTSLGASQTFTALVAAQKDGYCVNGIATGLTIGTAYWIDIALNRVTGGTATITGNTIVAHEI